MFRPDWRARRRPEVPDMNVRVLTVYEMRPTSRIASGIARRSRGGQCLMGPMYAFVEGAVR